MPLQINEDFKWPIAEIDAFEIDTLHQDMEDDESPIVGWTLFVHHIYGGRDWIIDSVSFEECEAKAKEMNPDGVIWRN